MGWNMISAKGSMFINENLRTCNLLELDLQHCGLNDTGGAFIANAIGGNETLLKVDMSNNNLSGGACSVLSEAIKKNNRIQEVNLKDNPLGLVGCRKLLQNGVIFADRNQPLPEHPYTNDWMMNQSSKSINDCVL
eukprot:scaffold142939_cov34-Prasinocladus_malaysianus.AAC.1